MHCRLRMWAMRCFSRLYLSCTDTRPVLDKYNLEKNTSCRTRNLINKTPRTVTKKQAANKIPDYHARSRASATSHLARANKSKRGKTSSTQPATRRNEHTWWIETAQPEYFWLWKNVGENRRPYLRRPPKKTFYTATSFDLKLASLSPTFDFASGQDSFFAARPLNTKAVSRSSRRNACVYSAETTIMKKNI